MHAHTRTHTHTHTHTCTYTYTQTTLAPIVGDTFNFTYPPQYYVENSMNTAVIIDILVYTCVMWNVASWYTFHIL